MGQLHVIYSVYETAMQTVLEYCQPRGISPVVSCLSELPTSLPKECVGLKLRAAQRKREMLEEEDKETERRQKCSWYFALADKLRTNDVPIPSGA